MMEKFGWSYQQYLQRPTWFDDWYEMKVQADNEAQKKKASTPNE
jgi:hypothetical protein